MSQNIGKAVDGPADGKVLKASTNKIAVPVPGKQGTGKAIYWWDGKVWKYAPQIH